MSKKISRRNRRIRNLLLVISMMMVVAMASVGVTVAWLTDKTDEIVNTFTASDISITLTESPNTLLDDEDNDPTTNKYKMVPGQPITKDPEVSVLANSETCWLFVKLDKSANFDDFMTFSVDTSEGEWTALDNVEDVYYREVVSSTSDQSFEVIEDDTVTVLPGVTKENLEVLNDETYPTLTVSAYAVQKASFGTAEDAWVEAVKLVNQ